MTSRSVGMPSGAAQPRPSPPSSRPTSPTSPELPRWRFKNASRKLGGYSSEWNDGKVFGSEEADEGVEEKVGFMEARARLKHVHDDEKRRKDAEFQGEKTAGDDQDDLKAEEQPEHPEQPEQTAPATADEKTDESSFDAAPDEGSAQPANPEETFSTANQEDDDRSLSTANSRAAQSHKSCFDELQTREGERLEEPKLAWGPNEEMKGLMQSLGRLVYGNQEESDESEEEISVVDEAPKADADAEEPAQEETQDVNAVNSTAVDLDDVDEEDEEADGEVETINSGDNGGDADDDELDKVEKQEKLDDVDLTTEEEPSVEHDDELEGKEKSDTEQPMQNSRRKKRMILLSILIVIVIVAVVLGVLLGGNSSDDGTCRADGEECVPNNCQNWKCGDTDCCCCGGLTCVADTGLGGERPMCA